MLTKTLKTKGSIPTEEAATKLIYLANCNFEKGGRAVREWVAARKQLAIMFNGRFDARPKLKTARASLDTQRIDLSQSGLGVRILLPRTTLTMPNTRSIGAAFGANNAPAG